MNVSEIFSLSGQDYYRRLEEKALVETLKRHEHCVIETGGSIVTHVEELPRSLALWRQFTQWLGGMGIIVLALAVLPRLRVGGRQLMESELPGPEFEAEWLQARLAASTAQWKVVYLHHPPFSSRTSWAKLQWPYQAWGADVVFAGHAHVYERIMRDGFPYITNGLGGDSTGSFSSALTGSVARFGSNYGAVLATVSQTSITFQFITRSGVIIDTYTMGPDAVTKVVAQRFDELEARGLLATA